MYVTYLRICENVVRYRFSFHGVTLTAPLRKHRRPRTPYIPVYTILSRQKQHNIGALHTTHKTHTLLWSFGLLIISARLLAAYVYLYISSNTGAQSSYAKPAWHIQRYRRGDTPVQPYSRTPTPTPATAPESIRIRQNSATRRTTRVSGVELYAVVHLEKWGCA